MLTPRSRHQSKPRRTSSAMSASKRVVGIRSSTGLFVDLFTPLMRKVTVISLDPPSNFLPFLPEEALGPQTFLYKRNRPSGVDQGFTMGTDCLPVMIWLDGNDKLVLRLPLFYNTHRMGLLGGYVHNPHTPLRWPYPPFVGLKETTPGWVKLGLSG